MCGCFSLLHGVSRKEVDTDGSEIRSRKLRLETLVGRQSRLARAGEEDIKLDEILIGKSFSLRYKYSIGRGRGVKMISQICHISLIVCDVPQSGILIRIPLTDCSAKSL